MKRLKYFILILLILFATGCNKNRGKLVLVTEAGFAPYEYYSGGEIVGVDISIGREIAKDLGKKLVVKDVAFDSIISEVKTGKSDFGAAGISYTEERAKEVDFTINYAESRQVIVVKKNSNITGPSNLSGKVAVQLGTTADSYLSENYSNKLVLIREKKFLAAIEDLKVGKVDAVVMDELPASKLITKDMKILKDAVVTDYYGMVVNKNNKELLETINKTIKKLKKEGKIDNLLLKHMGIEDKNYSGIYGKIYQTLIKDSRYKFILTGITNTLLIAIGALVIGIIFGLLIALIRNYHDMTGKLKILNFISKLYVSIIRGTPSILQLMILYYVVFASSNTNILLVGIISFGINSSAYVAEIIRGGLASVDKGQIEAGSALSLNYFQIMRYVVIPQGMKNALPSLGNEFITLVKETSVGAYIGIVELTKASDIIASRTYDYFFPLIIIALIYLLITSVLSKIVSKLEVKLNAKY